MNTANTTPTVIVELRPCPPWCTDHSRIDETLIHRGTAAEGDWAEGHTFSVALSQLEATDDSRRRVERDQVTLDVRAGKDYIACTASAAAVRRLGAAILAGADALEQAQS